METIDVFILSLFEPGYKVRRSTLPHLLTGKRTTSILIYGFFNQLLPYFSLFPKWPTADIDERLKGLITAQLLKESADQLLELTAKGRVRLEEQADLPVAQLNGLRFGRIDEEFFELMLFATQVVSEYVHNNLVYYPIEKNPAKQYQLKKWLASVPREKTEIGPAFYEEWRQLVMAIPKDYREAVVNLLSGHQQIGQTWGQVLAETEMSPFEQLLWRKNSCHQFLRLITENQRTYPYFYHLYQIVAERTVNGSAQDSYNLFLSGLAPLQIAEQRQLKISTVTDHLIEAAILEPAFPFERVLSEQSMAELTNSLQKEPQFRNWRYSQLLATYPDLSFLSFRCFQIQQIRGVSHD